MLKNKFSKFSKNATLVMAAFIFSIASAYAQGDFGTGIDAATTEVTSVFSKISPFIMIIGGVVGMIGAFRVYQKWNSGDQDINKELMGWGGSALFLVVAPIVIKAVFGI